MKLTLGNSVPGRRRLSNEAHIVAADLVRDVCLWYRHSASLRAGNRRTASLPGAVTGASLLHGTLSGGTSSEASARPSCSGNSIKRCRGNSKNLGREDEPHAGPAKARLPPASRGTGIA